jgi:hypothetical protein
MKLLILACPFIGITGYDYTNVFNVNLIKHVRYEKGSCSPDGHSCDHNVYLNDYKLLASSEKEGMDLMKKISKQLTECLKK